MFSGGSKKNNRKKRVNPFHTTDRFLYPLKASGIERFQWYDMSEANTEAFFVNEYLSYY